MMVITRKSYTHFPQINETTNNFTMLGVAMRERRMQQLHTRAVNSRDLRPRRTYFLIFDNGG